MNKAKAKSAMIRGQKKKTPRDLKKELWQVFSLYIRKRDGYLCYTCGRAGNQAGHYVPRSAGLALYFDETNVHCQCAACNIFLHGNLTEYAVRLEKDFGKGILQDLDKARRKTVKITAAEYREKIEYYRRKLEE